MLSAVVFLRRTDAGDERHTYGRTQATGHRHCGICQISCESDRRCYLGSFQLLASCGKILKNPTLLIDSDPRMSQILISCGNYLRCGHASRETFKDVITENFRVLLIFWHWFPFHLDRSVTLLCGTLTSQGIQ